MTIRTRTTTAVLSCLLALAICGPVAAQQPTTYPAFEDLAQRIQAAQAAPTDRAAQLAVAEAANRFVKAQYRENAEHTAAAIVWAVMAYRAANTTSELSRALDEWIALPELPTNLRALVQLQRVDTFAATRELAPALAIINTVLAGSETPYHPQFMRLKAETLIKLNRLRDAETFIAETITAHVAKWEVAAPLKLIAARMKLRAGQFDAAVALCTEAETVVKSSMRTITGDSARARAFALLIEAMTWRGRAVLGKGDTSAAQGIAQELRSRFGAGAAADLDAQILLPPGADAPAISLPNEQNAMRNLAAMRGKTVLVHFWSANCPASRVAMQQHLAVLNTEYRTKGLAIVSVAHAFDAGDTGAMQRDVVREMAIDWTTLFDADGSAAMAFGAKAAPFFALLDADGNVVLVGGGLAILDDVRAYLERR